MYYSSELIIENRRICWTWIHVLKSLYFAIWTWIQFLEVHILSLCHSRISWKLLLLCFKHNGPNQEWKMLSISVTKKEMLNIYAFYVESWFLNFLIWEMKSLCTSPIRYLFRAIICIFKFGLNGWCELLHNWPKFPDKMKRNLCK